MNLDFLCIGTQKSGTSWLDAMLRSHPDLWIPPVKELHYYDDLFLSFTRTWSGAHRAKGSKMILEWQRSLPEPDLAMIRQAEWIDRETVDADWYRKLFEMGPDGRKKGEVTPEYCLVPDEGIERIMADNPRAHFFLMLREPVARDLSHIRMMLAGEGFTAEQGIAGYGHRFSTYLEWMADEKRGDYLPILERWRQHVPQERFHVIFFESIARDPYGVLRRVCAPLGVDEKGVRDRVDSVVHQGREFPIPDWVIECLTRHHADAVAAIKAEFGPLVGW